MVGNLERSRSRSMNLALQIKAVELGLNPQHYKSLETEGELCTRGLRIGTISLITA